MTDLNKQELRRLAENAAFMHPTFAENAEAASLFDPVSGPEVVLALLDEIELLRHGVKGDFDLDAWLEWAKEAAKLRRDAERYRALREMNWCDGPLAVVADPYSRIKLGSDCPSHERLDEAVDSIMAKAASADAGVVDYD